MKKGIIENKSFYSKILNLKWEYNIYLPYEYDNNKKYNLIYMLHGASDDHHSWIKKGAAYQTLNNAIEANIIEPTIVIFPSGSPNTKDSWYVNSNVYKMQDAFEKELFSHIEETYSIKEGRENHSIGGLSMGGYGALRFALRNPNYFSSVFSLSPAIFDYITDDMKKIAYSPKIVEDSFEHMFLNIYGNPIIDEKLWHSLNYKALWNEYVKKQIPLKFFVSNGTLDTATPIEHTRIFDDFLKEKKTEHVYIEQKYLEHSWGAWAIILPDVLQYISTTK